MSRKIALLTTCCLITASMPTSSFALSMDDNLRTATLTILASRLCKNVKPAKVRFIIKEATKDAERQGVDGADFMAEVAQKVADLTPWFKKQRGICSDLSSLYR